jgi:HrpA-like RNA helicase
MQVRTIHTREGEGAVLVFLPGWDDITKVHEALQVISMSGSVTSKDVSGKGCRSIFLQYT